jgi:hypothetical protein
LLFLDQFADQKKGSGRRAKLIPLCGLPQLIAKQLSDDGAHGV